MDVKIQQELHNAIDRYCANTPSVRPFTAKRLKDVVNKAAVTTVPLTELMNEHMFAHMRAALSHSQLNELKRKKHYTSKQKARAVYLRLHEGMSLNKVAYLVGCSEAAVSKWCNQLLGKA